MTWISVEERMPTEEESCEGRVAALDDTARLDWVIRQADEFSCTILQDMPGDGDYFVTGMDGARGQGKTAREAIDAAALSQVEQGMVNAQADARGLDRRRNAVRCAGDQHRPPSTDSRNGPHLPCGESSPEG